jgi:hypothetical protein
MTRNKQWLGRSWVCLGLLAGLMAASPTQAAAHLEIRNGYFWDPGTSNHFIARGMAYQTWNPPVGADQSLEQIDYDLLEFKKLHANSLRVEFVWNQLEQSPGVFDWSKSDYLVAKAEELGLRLFVLIGFQYAPGWFPDAWRAVNNQGAPSVVLNYEHPEARRAYSNYISQVTRHYRNTSAIGAWILGNEYAYFDLWDPERHYLGYDAYSQASFRSYLAAIYEGNIARLNANWGTTYTNFSSVVMAETFPADRNNPGFHDLIQWRKQSVGDYVALGSLAAKNADSRHLRTYSMVGGIFGEADAVNTCEDSRTIVDRCAAAGAPLDFWSINNYAIASLDSEMRSGDFATRKHMTASRLPLLVTETGFSSTEDLHPGGAPRQAAALAGQMWEMLMSGAIGTHIFIWNDRDFFAGGYFEREIGFGIVRQNRLIKDPVYWNVAEMFRRMEQLGLEGLLPGSTNAPSDVGLLWSRSADLGWPLANQENIRTWSTLKRLGYQPGILYDEEFDSGAWASLKALLLSRCFQMEPRHLDTVVSNVVAAGIHVHANADLPSQFDAYHRPNPKWSASMAYLFGLNVGQAVAGWDAAAVSPYGIYSPLHFTGLQALGPITNGYVDFTSTWKIWDSLTAESGTTLITHTGTYGTHPPTPALQLKSLGTARTAANTFAIGNISDSNGQMMPHSWDIRYDWLRAIYRDHFGLPPLLDLTGPGAHYVIPNCRYCRNGSVLISLLNGHTNGASITLAAPSLLAGKTVENLTAGGILQTNSDGRVSLDLPGDGYVWLYVYRSDPGADASLVNPSPNKLWFSAAPPAVWPNGSNLDLTIGYDTREPGLNLVAAFEQTGPPGGSFAQTGAQAVSGRGETTLSLAIPDANLGDPGYLSSLEGGRYVFHAWLEKEGRRVSETFLPVRLLWGVRPLALPSSVTPGSTQAVTVQWQELPSYLPSEGPAPLNRATCWEPWKASLQYYSITLELWSALGRTTAVEFFTNEGSGQHTFNVWIPPEAIGPFTLKAFLRSTPEVSTDMNDSFEDRDKGAQAALFAPWQSFAYSEFNTAQSLAEGVDDQASDGRQAVFMVVTNPPNAGAFSGFGLRYVYPRPWSLPHDPRQCTNYTFAFTFKERSGQPCALELQVKDVRGGQIHFLKANTPASNRWDTVEASLSQFVIPPWVGFFDSARVAEIVVNVQMLQVGAMYQGSIDHIRFEGPEAPEPALSPQDVWDGFDDRATGAGTSALAPWTSYVYSERDTAAWLAEGVSPEAADGGQAAFLVISNPINPGAFAGFGLLYVFTNEWALPVDTNQWTNVTFSYAFREDASRQCTLEMQIKSGSNNWIQFTRPYAPGPGGWDTIRATLGQFVRPADAGPFDPAHVQAIAVNIRMREVGRVYKGLFDNIEFNAPDQILTPGAVYGTYTTVNDSLRVFIAREPTGAVTLWWWGNGTLQSAPAITGPWGDVTGGTNPHTIPSGGDPMFYRVRR